MSASLREQFEDAARHVPQFGDIDKAITTGVQRRHRTFAVATAVGMACVAIVAAVIWSTNPGGSQPEPLQQPTPSSDPNVGGWPDTNRNAPGEYALDGRHCGPDDYTGHYCVIGFMHNGYGTGDVDLYIGVDPRWARHESGSGGETPKGGVSTVIAGHEAVYQRIDARHETWVVDVDGTTVGIKMQVARGTSQADLTDAYNIIDSMRTEPDRNDIGFKLIFTLTNNEWDSG